MERDEAGCEEQARSPGEGDVATAMEQAIRLADGDVRAALAASLVAKAYLEVEIERLEAAVARGYVRGRLGSKPGGSLEHVRSRLNCGQDR